MSVQERWSTMAGLLAAIAVLAVALTCGRRRAQDSRGATKSCRSAGHRTRSTLNPFVGQDEEDFTIWAINWDLLVNFSPRTSRRRPASPRAGRSPTTARRSPSTSIPDAKWSDGEPITSEDVKYSLEVLGSKGALFTSYTDNITSIETPDDHTVVDPDEAAGRADRRRPLHLHPPRAHLGEGARRRADRLLRARRFPLVGSGPYVVTEFQPGRILRMEQNPELPWP